jgi:hypothetical protein
MNTPIDINSLFQAVQSSGALSTASMQALTIADIDAMIQAGLGTPVDGVTASAVRAGQSAAHFGQAVLGGFGAP